MSQTERTIQGYNCIFTGSERRKPEITAAMLSCYEFLKLEDVLERADVIFILGGSTVGPARKAAELYKSGYANKIAFISTGGNFGGHKIWGMTEDKKYKEELERLGIPSEAIISKGLTTNTKDEAREAVPFLRNNGVDPQKIILVSRPVHQRRAWATFEKQQPGIKYINCPADEPLNNNDRAIKRRLTEEVQRLSEYTAKGDITAQDIPPRIKEAVKILKEDLNVEKFKIQG
ncbi:MAG TPA: YdcF family protein [Patescibacteria group bacterium]